jgi:hypothetical protein
MRRPIQVLVAVAALLLGGATVFLYTQLQDSRTTNDKLQTASRATQEQYAQTIGAIATIQDSLNAIGPRDQPLSADGSKLSEERRMGAPSGEEALERISLLRASIERNKQRIDRLEASLRTSKLHAGGLAKLVASLRRTTVEKEAQIALLSAQVDTLHVQVGALTTHVAEVEETVRVRDVTVADRQRELATVYWVAGEKGALQKAGVIESRGGLLGMGKTLKPSGRAPGSAFHQINTDEQSVIQLSSAKAQVISAQPLSSYELRPINGKIELHIIEPQEFRKVRQLVIVTT